MITLRATKEYGMGRPDIVIMLKDKNKKAYILEFKNEYTSSGRTAEQAANEALQQIKDMKYEEGVRHTGVKDIMKIGLGFKGKQLKLAIWE